MADASTLAPTTTEVATTPDRPKSRWRRWALMLSVPLIIAAVGAYFWLNSGKTATTDNAYVQQDRVALTADVGGKIIDVRVRENDHVKAGDVLFRIDPSSYELQLAQAQAALAQAETDIRTLGASVSSNAGAIAAARDSVTYAQQNFDRHNALMARGFDTRANLDAARHQLEQARAQLISAQAAADVDRAKLSASGAAGGENAQIAAARAQIAAARLALQRTTIVAPADGVVTRTDNLQVGQMATPGLPMMTLVTATRAPWIEANFKETDLKRMVPGLPATIRIDAYPDVTLRGHVDSIGAGTGSEFSVLPAQNANGNWVKVTQRVPVRIVLDEPASRPLLAGLSAEVEVDLTATEAPSAPR